MMPTTPSSPSTAFMREKAEKHGFSVDEIDAATTLLANPLLGAKVIASTTPTSMDSTMIRGRQIFSTMFTDRLQKGKPWQGPLPGPRISPPMTLGDCPVLNRRSTRRRPEDEQRPEVEEGIQNLNQDPQLTGCSVLGQHGLNSELAIWTGSEWARYRRNALGRLLSRRGKLPECYRHNHPPSRTLTFSPGGERSYAAVVRRGLMEAGGASGAGGFNGGGHNGNFQGAFSGAGGGNFGAGNNINNGGFPGNFMAANDGAHPGGFQGDRGGQIPPWNGQMHGNHFGQVDGQGFFRNNGPTWSIPNQLQQQGGAFGNGHGFPPVHGRGNGGFMPTMGPSGQQQIRPPNTFQDGNSTFGRGAETNQVNSGMKVDQNQGWQHQRGRFQGAHGGRGSEMHGGRGRGGQFAPKPAAPKSTESVHQKTQDPVVLSLQSYSTEAPLTMGSLARDHMNL